MKRAALALCVVGFTATAAFAEWLVDFKQNYSERGIEIAVEEAMKEGAAPISIVENGVQLEGISHQNLVKALYCAGANGPDIRDAAAQYNITEAEVAAGFKKSVEECGDRVADTQAFSVQAAGPSFGGRGDSGGGGNSYASPNQFRNRRGN